MLCNSELRLHLAFLGFVFPDDPGDAGNNDHIFSKRTVIDKETNISIYTLADLRVSRPVSHQYL
jgi:hypothetical protein